MHKVTFECETITPMFMAGADGKTPELRPPSIKGAMRFWWRAMNGHLGLDELRKQEAAIFGGTGENVGKSFFNLRVRNINGKISDFKPLPHHTGDFNCEQCKETGVTGKCNKGFILPCYSITTTFDIFIDLVIVKLKKIQDEVNPQIKKEYIFTLLEILQILGGLGKRSRRGFGSFLIKSNYFTMHDLVTRLNSISANSFQLDPAGNKITNVRSNLTNEIPYIQNITIGKSYNVFYDVLVAIGKASHDFNNQDGQLGYANKRNGRMASPIYVSVVKISDSDYRPIITTLNTVLPNSMTVRSFEEQKKFKEALI